MSEKLKCLEYEMMKTEFEEEFLTEYVNENETEESVEYGYN